MDYRLRKNATMEHDLKVTPNNYYFIYSQLLSPTNDCVFVTKTSKREVFYVRYPYTGRVRSLPTKSFIEFAKIGSSLKLVSLETSINQMIANEIEVPIEVNRLRINLTRFLEGMPQDSVISADGAKIVKVTLARKWWSKDNWHQVNELYPTIEQVHIVQPNSIHFHCNRKTLESIERGVRFGSLTWAEITDVRELDPAEEDRLE